MVGITSRNADGLTKMANVVFTTGLKLRPFLTASIYQEEKCLEKTTFLLILMTKL